MAHTGNSDGMQQGLLVEKEKPAEISFSGVIDRIIFQNRDNGYAIMRVMASNQEAGRNGIPLYGLTCVGTLLNPQGGMRLRFTGRFVNNARFGRQFAFSSAEEQMPASESGLISYLSSGLIKGMGRDMAQRVVQEFGADTMRILDEEPDKLLKIRGIGQKNLKSIAESWREHRSISSLMQFLQPHGISPAYGVRIYNVYGPQALEKVQENPYCLAMDIRGIGFTTADAIAQKLGVPENSPLRVQGAVLYILQKASDSGDVFMPYSLLVRSLEEEMQIELSLIRPALDALEQSERIIVDAEPLAENEFCQPDDRAVYLARLYHCESKTAYYLERLQRMPRNVSFKNADKQVGEVLQSFTPRLAEAQAEAVRMAARNKVMVLTGGPGTGKTTIIRAIISLFEKLTSRISLAAPTGRAAKRMAEATGKPASTIHRLLEYNPVENEFMRNEDEPLVCDLLIVDEASMMDVVLFYYLMKAVPSGCTVLLVGDTHQLPSVGPGTVLGDIISSRRVAVIELNEIFRQARTSAIVSNAHLINNGVVPELFRPWEKDTDFFFLPCPDGEEAADDMVSLIVHEIPERYGFNPRKDIQLLTPMHKGSVGTQNMNARLQDALNPQKAGQVQVKRSMFCYRIGDKVMQTRNNYDKEIFNGDLGVITGIDKENKIVSVLFDEEKTVEYELGDLDELVLAYAISIHKSQGSEYPCVIVPLFMHHYVMLQRNLVYTAITRGKKLVVVVGEPRALAQAVRNTSVKHRYTRLAWRLGGSMQGMPSA